MIPWPGFCCSRVFNRPKDSRTFTSRTTALRFGARADLILTTADPLEDVRNVNRRAGVMVRGRWLPEEDLQASLKRLAASYESNPTPR